MKLCLIRHGETAWALTGQHTGITDIGLTTRGEDEARALAPHLRTLALSQVLLSPRLRARQTCELAGVAGASVVEADLAEWDYGDYEGLRTADIHRGNPEWNIWQDGCPGGESPAQVSARADRLISHLCTLQGTLALFSHGHFSVALAMRWIGLALIEGQHFALHTASVSLLGIDGQHQGRRIIELWNQRLNWPSSPAPTE
jgi:probable phosphoglycerate mutase